ncbi:MAG: hypothetical protein L0H26_11425, partial [Microlunatus sp.]|nr:hypothetical protein [Microlunatus sp.]
VIGALRDRVLVTVPAVRDRNGTIITPEHDEGPFPASIQPVRSDEAVAYGQPPLTAYYRLVMGSAGGPLLRTTGAVKWMGRKFVIQGDAERWSAGGAVHHYAATLKAFAEWPI